MNKSFYIFAIFFLGLGFVCALFQGILHLQLGYQFFLPICGGGAPALAHEISNTPVWAFHGRKDRNVPVSESRDMIEAIKKAGGNPKYTEFPDADHNIWNNVIDTPGLMDWLFAQKKDVDIVHEGVSD